MSVGARELGPKLWIVDGDPVRMYTIPFETRMTLIGLEGGGLWVHSPVAFSEERRAQVSALGSVQHLVAPTGMHNLYLEAWHAHFPEATRWIEPGVARRVPGFAFEHLLEDDTVVPWSDEIEHVHVTGSSMLNELVFFHRPSKTVIFTDIIQNHDPAGESWMWRQVKAAIGVLAPAGSSPRDWRLTVQHKPAVRQAVDRILAWDIQQVIVSHGLCVTGGAREFVTRAFAWVR